MAESPSKNVHGAVISGASVIDGWALDVIETLIRATDDQGRKVYLDGPTQRQILQRAVDYSSAMEADMKPGGAFHAVMTGIAAEGTKNG